MKRVLSLLLCAVMVLGLTACKKEESGDDETPVTSATVAAPTDATPKVYAHNEIINRFFVKYLTAYPRESLDPDTIRRGADLQEYYAVVEGCEVKLSDISKKKDSSGIRYALQIEISGGSTIKSRDALFLAFAKIAQAADSDCSSLAVERITAQLEEAAQVMTREMQVSPRVWIASYAPIIENEEMAVSVPCRMVLRVTDPLVTDDTVTTTSATK